MICNFELRADLGCYVCTMCRRPQTDDTERTCTVSEAQRLQMQRINRKKKSGGCGCTKKKQQTN